jgi:hypothetical protein
MKTRDLENDPRLARILRTRGLLFGLEGAVAAVMAVLVMFLNGFSFRPPYFPVSNIILIAIFIFLVMSAEKIFFFRLAMRYGKRKGVMFLIAKRVFRSSIAILVLSLLAVILLFAVNYMPVFNVHGSVSGPVGTANFESGNDLGLFTVGYVTIYNPTGSNLTFVIVTQGDYLASGATPQAANESVLIASNLAGGNDFVPAGGSTTVQVVTTPNTDYYIVAFSSAGNVQAQYTLGMKASPSLFYSLFLAAAIIPFSGYLGAAARREMSALRTETIFK